MKLFKISYSLKNGSVMTVGIVSDNRETAVNSLLSKQKNVKNIDSIYIGDDVHLITDDILESIINNTPRIKKLKGEIQYLKNLLMESDDEIEKLRDGQVSQTQPININETSILHDKIVELETQLINVNEGKTVEKFICPECLKEFKSTTAVKSHYTKTHKEK